MPTDAKKKIFISDIHMGDIRSFDGAFPYGWFRANITHLKDFLIKQLGDKDVAEVVILGDLFDRWVIPADQDPLPDFQKIVAFDQNQPVITALKELAAKGKLTYIPGNHDMILSDAELTVNRNFMERAFDGIRYDPHQNGKYSNGTIVGEHGNRYGLFNAPDKRIWTDGESSLLLPIGYFMSRENAYGVAHGSPGEFHEVLKTLVQKYIHNPKFIYLLYTEMAQYAGRDVNEVINMNNINGFPNQPQPTVDAIGTRYQDLIEKWGQEGSANLDWPLAVAGDIGQLLLAAAIVHFLHSSPPPKIVIFGHSHKPELWRIYKRSKLAHQIIDILLPHYHEVLEELQQDLQIPDLQISEILKEFIVVKDLPIDFPIDFPCNAIYVNSGTWVDKSRHPTRTYVEIEELVKGKDRRLYVRLKTYPAMEELYKGYVNL
jgi:hypothetical protein